MKHFKDIWGIAVIVIPIIIKYIDDKDKKNGGKK